MRKSILLECSSHKEGARERERKAESTAEIYAAAAYRWQICFLALSFRPPHTAIVAWDKVGIFKGK
jgi:hypothetical protein